MLLQVGHLRVAFMVCSTEEIFFYDSPGVIVSVSSNDHTLDHPEIVCGLHMASEPLFEFVD